MGWDNITGESNILTNNTGNADEIRFESGKMNKVRLVLPDGQEPYSYLEHCLEVETFENGQQTRNFRTIRCPKTSKNPTAHCPLCDGQQVRRRVRHACNVFDYDTNKIQKLNAGETVFKTIATTRKMGVDILGVDWGIMKSGTDRNDTSYTTTNLGQSQFTYDPNTMGALFDIEAEYQPATIDEMKAIVESIGGDWHKLTTAPQLVYPTLQNALAHVMPNGKYKDMTFSQIWDMDKSPRGFIAYLALKSDRQNDEKAAAQVIYTRLGGVPIDGVPREDDQQPVQQAPSTPVQPSTPPVQPSTPPVQPSTPAQQAQGDNGRQEKISKINEIFSTDKKFIEGGFDTIIETLKQFGNGKANIQDFTDTELDNLLNGCKSE